MADVKVSNSSGTRFSGLVKNVPEEEKVGLEKVRIRDRKTSKGRMFLYSLAVLTLIGASGYVLSSSDFLEAHAEQPDLDDNPETPEEAFVDDTIKKMNGEQDNGSDELSVVVASEEPQVTVTPEKSTEPEVTVEPEEKPVYLQHDLEVLRELDSALFVKSVEQLKRDYSLGIDWMFYMSEFTAEEVALMEDSSYYQIAIDSIALYEENFGISKDKINAMIAYLKGDANYFSSNNIDPAYGMEVMQLCFNKNLSFIGFVPVENNAREECTQIFMIAKNICKSSGEKDISLLTRKNNDGTLSSDICIIYNHLIINDYIMYYISPDAEINYYDWKFNNYSDFLIEAHTTSDDGRKGFEDLGKGVEVIRHYNSALEGKLLNS